MFKDIIDIVYKYGGEYEREVYSGMPYSQYGNLESLILYCFLRDRNIKHLIEIGCESHSRSTYIIQKALLKNGIERHTIVDFEHILTNAYNNLFDKTNVTKFAGDITKTYEQLIPELKKCDFLFIDADHERDFAVFYLDKLIPNLKNGTYVHIHDINLSGDWVDRDGRNNEAYELIERHKNNTLNLEKLFWLEDLSVNESYKNTFNLIKRYYYIGSFPATSLPFNASASYWRAKTNNE